MFNAPAKVHTPVVIHSITELLYPTKVSLKNIMCFKMGQQMLAHFNTQKETLLARYFFMRNCSDACRCNCSTQPTHSHNIVDTTLNTVPAFHNALYMP